MTDGDRFISSEMHYIGRHPINRRQTSNKITDPAFADSAATTHSTLGQQFCYVPYLLATQAISSVDGAQTRVH